MSEEKRDAREIATDIAEAVFMLKCPDLQYVACCSLVRHAIEEERRAERGGKL